MAIGHFNIISVIALLLSYSFLLANLFTLKNNIKIILILGQLPTT